MLRRGESQCATPVASQQLLRVPVARPAETTCGPAATEADAAADA